MIYSALAKKRIADAHDKLWEYANRIDLTPEEKAEANRIVESVRNAWQDFLRLDDRVGERRILPQAWHFPPNHFWLDHEIAVITRRQVEEGKQRRIAKLRRELESTNRQLSDMEG